MTLTAAQRAIVERALAEDRIPGVAVAVVRRGEVIGAEGFGARDLEAGLPMTATTVHPICSLTKSFTAVAVMQLVEAGSLSLDEPVATYLPEFRLRDERAAGRITARLLLSHRSGLGRTGHQPRMHEPVVPYRDRADLVSRLNETELQTPPGEAWSYSNEGYVVLSLLVERLGGMAFEERLHRGIFDRLGMAATCASFPAWRAAPEATQGYDRSGDGYARADAPDDYAVYCATGGVCSTAADMARYLIATLDYGDSPLLSAGALDAMHSISAPHGDSGRGYGLGWSIGWSDGQKVASHGGSQPGIANHALLVPGEGLGVVVLTNRRGAPARRIAEELADDALGRPLFGAGRADASPIRTAHAQPDSTPYAGEYGTTYGARPFRLHVRIEEGRLHLTSTLTTGPDGTRATAVGPDLFLGAEGGAVRFLRDGDGRVVAALDGGLKLVRV
jgi:beta-lactamase class C